MTLHELESKLRYAAELVSKLQDMERKMTFGLGYTSTEAELCSLLSCLEFTPYDWGEDE